MEIINILMMENDLIMNMENFIMIMEKNIKKLKFV